MRAQQAEISRASSETERGGTDALHRARILLADSDAALREYLARLLEGTYEVETVADGSAALDAARQRPPSLILAAGKMPGLDGFALLRELRADPHTRTIPLILLSIRAGEGSPVEGPEPDDSLIKPVNPSDLLTCVRSHLEISRIRQEATQREQRLRAELQATQETCDRVLASVHDAVILLDPAWRFGALNDRAVQLLGRPRDALLGQRIWEVYPDLVGGELYREAHRAVTEHESVHFKYMHPAGNRWLDVRLCPSANGLAMVLAEISGRQQTEKALQRAQGRLEATVRERTAELATTVGVLVEELAERKQAEGALRESEERFRLLVEGVRDYAIFLLDPEGRVASWNAGAERIKGYPAEEILGEHFSRFYASEDVARGIPERELEIARTEGRTEYEGWRFRKDGSRFWANVVLTALRDADGHLRGFAKVTRDVTERKEAEERQRLYAERLKILHEIDRAVLAAASPETIARAVLAHVQRLVPSPRTSIVLLDPEAQVGRVLADSLGGEIRLPEGALLPLEGFGKIEELRQGKVTLGEDLRALRQPSPARRALPDDGVRAYIHVPLLAHGTLIGTLRLGSNRLAPFLPEHLEIAREVADSLAVAIQQARLRARVERHAAELEREVTERTSELQEANAELEAFAYSVSHDLRAPLRAMQGFAQALLEDYGGRLDEVGQDYAKRVVSSSQRMEALIQDLLDYCRVGRTKIEPKPVRLSAAVAEVLAELDGELRQREAEVTVEEPLPAVLGHHATLLQAISNLLTNAVKFVAPGTRPRVRVWAERRQEARGGLDPAVIRLWVEDNGIGITPEHQEQIFRLFERLHGGEEYPGTGIGLAIVRRSVERLGGRAGVESAVGAGSRFWIELPSGETGL
jgi:PAS domain S-box-containing protein